LPSNIPRPSDFGQTIDGVNDPRFAQIVQHLKPGVNLADRVAKILKSTEIRVDDGRIDAGDLEKAASRPKVTTFDLESAAIEAHEINGHLVYYVQPKCKVDPDTFASDIVQPALGAAWDHMKVEGWVEQEPNLQHGVSTWIWGIYIHDLKVNALNRAIFMRRVPQEFDRLLRVAATDL